LTADLFYPDPLLNREVQVGEWWGAEAHVSKKLFDRHTFTFGAEYRDDFRQDRANFNDDVLNIEQHGSRESYGVYLQTEIALTTNLFLNAGGRYDWYSTFGDTLNPRIALMLHPWESSSFKAIGGTAFRSPNFFETAFNSSLQPESITTYELVYDQAYGSHWHSALSLYQNEIDNLITFRDGTYANVEGADARGAELELRGAFAGGLSTRLSYAFQETRDRESGNLLTDSPKHLAKANLTVPLPIPHFEEKIFADLEAEYSSRRLTLLGGHASGFGLLNFTLFSQNLLPGLEVSASIYNLLDKTYSDPATPFHLQDLIEQNGRTFRVKVTYRF
jgi:iron complex outermembrane receptor protein